MKIAVLGTGVVGSEIGTALVEGGHEVMMGSRTAVNEKAVQWANSTGESAHYGTFADAAAFSDGMVFNCTRGDATIEALAMAGANNLEGKIIVDLANPLDFSKGMPPSLTVCNTDSLGEQIQREFPGAKVVKVLNTLNCRLMLRPADLAGSHNLFIAGNDEEAKATVSALLQTFGWASDDIIDLGDISAARGTEMLLPLWIRLMQKLGTAHFNFKIVK